MDDEPRHTVMAAGLAGYVRVLGSRGDQRVVLCRACGISSPPLAAGQEMDWFKRHAATLSKAHLRARSKK